MDFDEIEAGFFYTGRQTINSTFYAYRSICCLVSVTVRLPFLAVRDWFDPNVTERYPNVNDDVFYQFTPLCLRL